MNFLANSGLPEEEIKKTKLMNIQTLDDDLDLFQLEIKGLKTMLELCRMYIDNGDDEDESKQKEIQMILSKPLLDIEMIKELCDTYKSMISKMFSLEDSEES